MMHGPINIRFSKALVRPVATSGSELWILIKDIAKRLAAFEGNVSRIMSGELMSMKSGESHIIQI